MDVEKTLFNHKLAKLVQQANFYLQEMGMLFSQDLNIEFDELMSLKESSISEHKSFLAGIQSVAY